MASLKQHDTATPDQPVTGTAESLTLEKGQVAWYVDAFGHEQRCVVVHDEGPPKRVYIRLDRRKGQCWFDGWERDKLKVGEPRKTTVQP